jgi:spermidine synthase
MTAGSDPRVLGRGHWISIGTIFFLSGALSLIYQVLWMKELSLLFGSTAQATATTLTAFFLGLAVGGWSWGRIAPRLARPLRAYGMLELGIAGCVLFYFVLFDLYGLVYPVLAQEIGHRREVLLIVKFLLGIVVLFPASFLMGGTLPVLGQHMVRTPETLGLGGSALYTVNTLGAALGAYLAGFHLPPLLGFDLTYLLAAGANGLLAAVVLAASLRAPPGGRVAAVVPTAPAGSAPMALGRIWALAFASGFVTLALEVLWMQMFAQVLHNSVFTFAIILITFLLALAAGAALAHELIRRGLRPRTTLCLLLVAGGVLVAVTPHLFHFLTDGLTAIGSRRGWLGYQVRVFGLAGLVILLPTLILGAVFPYLMKLGEAHGRGAGWTLGRLAAANTLGAILGSLVAGFLLIGWIGLWASIQLLGAAVLVAALLVAVSAWAEERRSALLACVAVVAVLVGVGSARLPIVKLAEGQRLLGTWQGSSGIVTVLQSGENRLIKVDNHYTLGSALAIAHQAHQGAFPLLLHPAPRDIFFLGMGTGITAGGALTHSIDSVVVCELVPEAITAAARFFSPYANGLFEDPRVTIVAEDGRVYLRTTKRKFDVIVADLFVPWKAGTGNLYSKEHFETARDHLEDGGLFVQWLSLSQISRDEFDVIARTMTSVFPLVTVWRGDFHPTRSLLALVGHQRPSPLRGDWRWGRNAPSTLATEFIPSAVLSAYAGNLTAASGLLGPGPINEDDRPRLEFQAPVTQRRVAAGQAHWLLRDELIDFYERLRSAVPAERDPYLSAIDPKRWPLVAAGLLRHRQLVHKAAGRTEQAAASEADLKALLARLSRE